MFNIIYIREVILGSLFQEFGSSWNFPRSLRKLQLRQLLYQLFLSGTRQAKTNISPTTTLYFTFLSLNIPCRVKLVEMAVVEQVETLAKIN